jgi:hypothetical protein
MIQDKIILKLEQLKNKENKVDLMDIKEELGITIEEDNRFDNRFDNDPTPEPEGLCGVITPADPDT